MVKIKHYFSLVKFSHTIFAMPFALIGYFWGVYNVDYFDVKLLMYVCLCMVFARNAAMSFNRYIDRDIDKLNDRTASREIPSGVITPQKAMSFIIINAILFIATTFFINKTAAILSPIALIIILGYSLTKRFTALCHLVLGLSLAIAPMGAYIAVTGRFSGMPLLLSLIVIGWGAGFDIFYSTHDREFDEQNNLYSLPSRLGIKRALLISILLRVVSVLCIAAIGIIYLNNYMYWTGAFIFILLIIYQHIIVKPNDLKKVDMAFSTLNACGSVIFSIFTILSMKL